MKRVAIIPARGGSKRIPGKNTGDFLGKPIIAYSIEAALESKLFDEVMVSTEDERIASLAASLGAKVPFLRSQDTAGDHSTTVEVLSEVLYQYRTRGVHYDVGCCIYPTAPLIRKSRLLEALELLISKGYSSVFPVVAYSYPIWRSFRMSDNNKVEMNWPENLNVRSQDLPQAYHDAGQFYWFVIADFLREQRLFGHNCGAIALAESEVQDIDNPEDWKMAELKYQLLYG